MKLDRHSLRVQFSPDGGASWSALDDDTFGALLREWSAARADILTRLRAGELVRSPHVARFVYRTASGQMPLALETAA